MVSAAKKLSQVITHMGIAYALAYTVTGSAIFSGLAVIVEPVINVLLLPLHEAAWEKRHRRLRERRARLASITAEKISQTALHAGVAFGVMYVATGSAALGGVAAVLEPVCNVLVLPFHDRFWDRLGHTSAAPLRSA
jgi:uncharacterized membrane protein